MGKEKIDDKKDLICGIVMPIASIDDCTEQHWLEIKSILYSVIEDTEFNPAMVFEADDVTIIQKSIVQNLYQNEIVICDISGKNPNVMFELGLRLAFDKPTIVIKDDKTDYSFDTSPIEHLNYPRDLRYTKILKFKEDLKKKIEGTWKKAKSDPEYSTFLKHFGPFKSIKIDTQEITKEDLVLEKIEEMNYRMRRLERMTNKERIIFGEKEYLSSRSKHKLDPDACERMIEFTITELLNKYDLDHRISRKTIFDIINNTDEFSLPVCYDWENNACRKMLDRVLAKFYASHQIMFNEIENDEKMD